MTKAANRILVSGFETFAGLKTNPTEILIQQILKDQEYKDPFKVKDESLHIGLQIEGLVLPVSYEKAFPFLKQKILQFQPHYVIATGVAMKRDRICLESKARNIQNAKIADNMGKIFTHQKIASEGPEELFSTLPLKDIQRALSEVVDRVQISEDAGTYVCNTLMYQLIQDSQKNNYRAGFIHIPNTRSENNSEVYCNDEDIYLGFKALFQTLC